MDVLTSSLLARVFGFACAGTLLLSSNSALALTLAFLRNLNDNGVALIIAFSIGIVLFLIIYISELASVALLAAKRQH